MKNKAIMALAAILFACTSVFGQVQSNNYGYLMRQQDLTSADILRFSQFNNSIYGTARSTAMAGAFTSLGADLSSMNINPAGLGMYRSTEVSITSALTFGNTSSSVRDLGFEGGDHGTNRFILNNFAAAFNVYQGSGTLTSFTLGFGYNKLADYNYNSGIQIEPTPNSLVDVFGRQLNGVRLGTLNGEHPWSNYDLPVGKWGAALGYYNYLIDPVNDNIDNTSYILAPSRFNPNFAADHFMRTRSRGSIGEYSIAGGFNFSNILYLGFTVGIQDIYQNVSVSYNELFYDQEDLNEDYIADEMQYNQYVRHSGTGVNFKFGAIVRPIGGLRIGLAVHTPTYMTLRKEYHAEMAVWNMDGYSSEDSYDRSGLNYYDYNIQTPTRLMAGISYAFQDYGILSVDYERTWYNKMKDRENYPDSHVLNNEINDFFRASNSIRIGAEVKPTPEFSIRAGYSFQGSILNSDLTDIEKVLDYPMAYESYSISGGIGYRFAGRCTIDLTYAYLDTKYTDYSLYHSTYSGNRFELASEDIYLRNLKQSSKKHNVILSFGVRF